MTRETCTTCIYQQLLNTLGKLVSTPDLSKDLIPDRLRTWQIKTFTCIISVQSTTNFLRQRECFYLYMGQFPRKCPLAINIKYYKICFRLNRYNVRTVKAIDFLFSKLNTTSFLCGKIDFGVLHLLRVSIATFDTPPSSNPP